MPTTSLTKKRLLIALLTAAWVLLVLYPNPLNLFASVYRLKNPPVVPLQVAHLALDLENRAPYEIEQFVYRSIPYQFDWEVYNMPWYFPTLDEILQNGRGDCKSRFLLFASLMEELDLPYYKNVSLTHIWVGYEGKKESGLENYNESMIVVDQHGQVRLSLPRPDLRRSGRSFYQGFWEVMPAERKLLLLSGFPMILGIFSLQTLFNQPFTGPLYDINIRRKSFSRLFDPDQGFY